MAAPHHCQLAHTYHQHDCSIVLELKHISGQAVLHVPCYVCRTNLQLACPSAHYVCLVLCYDPPSTCHVDVLGKIHISRSKCTLEGLLPVCAEASATFTCICAIELTTRCEPQPYKYETPASVVDVVYAGGLTHSGELAHLQAACHCILAAWC